MGIKLEEVAEGSHVTLSIHNEGANLELNATLKKHLKPDIALISIDYDARLVFDHVFIRMQYEQEGDVPVIWNNVKIVAYKSDYVMQATSDGVRNNRRNAFRVGVSKLADVRSSAGAKQVMVRDISLSGFSVSDRKGELSLKIGDNLSIKLDDMGCILNLSGKVVRIEKQEGVMIYGFEICNLCKDLSTYVTLKQRRNREHKNTER